MVEYKKKLINNFNLSKKDIDEIIDVLASAELMLCEINENKDIDFTFDYSGIIILYCKAIEKFEKKECKLINKELMDILESYNPGRKIDRYNKNKVIEVKIPYDKTLDKMKELTVSGKYENGDPFSIFEYWRAANKLVKYMNGIEGDMFTYNTLLLLYSIYKRKINELRFEIFKRVFELYHKDRNGSAHTHLKSRQDVERVRNAVIGEDNDSSSSLMYKLLYNLN